MSGQFTPEQLAHLQGLLGGAQVPQQPQPAAAPVGAMSPELAQLLGGGPPAPGQVQPITGPAPQPLPNPALQSAMVGAGAEVIATPEVAVPPKRGRRKKDEAAATATLEVCEDGDATVRARADIIIAAMNKGATPEQTRGYLDLL